MNLFGSRPTGTALRLSDPTESSETERKKDMKTVKKIMALLLVCATLCGSLMLCSCGHKNDIPIAYVDGTFYYGNDPEIRDYLLFYFATNNIDIPESQDALTTEYVAAYNLCVETVIWNHVYEKALRREKVKIDKSAIRNAAKTAKEAVDLSYEGGYKQMKKDLGISTDIIYNVQRYQYVLSLVQLFLFDKINLSDEELTKYYKTHIADYRIELGYYYDAILLEVLDLQNDEEIQSKKAEAETVIKRLSGGEDFDTVRKEIIAKYSTEGYFYTGLVSADGILAEDQFDAVSDDLSAEIDSLNQFYEECGISYDKNADKDSEAFSNYQLYLNSRYRVELVYALTQATKDGEIYENPIYSPIGYVVIRNNKHITEGGFTPFDEVKADVLEKAYGDAMDVAFENYKKELTEKYTIVFNSIQLEQSAKEN